MLTAKQDSSKQKQIIAAAVALMVIFAAFFIFKIGLFNQTNKSNLLNIPILTYHHIASVDDKVSKIEYDLNVSPDIFDNQLSALKKANYTTILSSDLANFIYNKVPLPKNPILITIDDGFLDGFTESLPLLLKYNFKANFAIPSSTVGSSGHLNLDQIKQLYNAGMGIDSHSVNHCSLNFKQNLLTFFKQIRTKDTPGCSDFGSKQSLSKEQITFEIKKSKLNLEDILSTAVDTFVYPFGDYNDEVIKIVQESGYKIAYTTDDQSLTNPQIDITKPYAIPRYHVFGQQFGHLTGFFASLKYEA